MFSIWKSFWIQTVNCRLPWSIILSQILLAKDDVDENDDDQVMKLCLRQWTKVAHSLRKHNNVKSACTTTTILGTIIPEVVKKNKHTHTKWKTFKYFSSPTAVSVSTRSIQSLNQISSSVWPDLILAFLLLLL